MARKTPRDRYDHCIASVKEMAAEGEIAEADAERIEECCAAYDKDNITVPKPEGESFKEHNTLGNYAFSAGKVAREVTLTEATADEINMAMQSFHDGSAETVKDDGLAKSTVRQYQMAVRSFFGYHTDMEVDPGDIATFKQEGTKVDPDDMLTREEIQQIRDATEHPRDKAIVDLLLYTGQRVSALRTLKIKHVDVEQGEYRLNGEADGLKGADDVGSRRPLLLAQASVRQWLDYHPAKDDPEAYLITAKPKWNKVDPRDSVSHQVFRYVTEKLAEETDINKPLNPHSIRHNFVTIAKRDYEMDNDTIKYLIGHMPDSKVMETTYAHLSEQDYMDKARQAVGLEQIDPSSPFTPDVCPQCGHNPPENAKACPTCGMIFTPDAKATQDRIDREMWDSKGEAETDDEEEAVDQLKNLLNEHPELLDKLTDMD